MWCTKEIIKTVLGLVSLKRKVKNRNDKLNPFILRVLKDNSGDQVIIWGLFYDHFNCKYNVDQFKVISRQKNSISDS